MQQKPQNSNKLFKSNQTAIEYIQSYITLSKKFEKQTCDLKILMTLKIEFHMFAC